MAIVYSPTLWDDLAAAGYPLKRLKKERILFPSVIAKINRNEIIPFEIIERLSRILQCDAGDLYELFYNIE